MKKLLSEEKKPLTFAVVALVAVACAVAGLIAQMPDDPAVEEADLLNIRLDLLSTIDDATARRDTDMLSLFSRASREMNTIHDRLADSTLTRELSSLGLSEDPLLATGSTSERIAHLVERLSHPVAVARTLSLLGLGDDPGAAIIDLEDNFDSTLRNFDWLLNLFDEDPDRATKHVSRIWRGAVAGADVRTELDSMRTEIANARSRLKTDPTLVATVLSRHLSRDPILTAQVLTYGRVRQESPPTSGDARGEPTSVVSMTGLDFIICLSCTMAQAIGGGECENEHGKCIHAAQQAGRDIDDFPPDTPPEAQEEIRQLRIEIAEERCETALHQCTERIAQKAKLCCLIASAIPF